MCSISEINIGLGDLNAKFGKQQDSYTVGKYRLGECNDRGNTLVEWE